MPKVTLELDEHLYFDLDSQKKPILKTAIFLGKDDPICTQEISFDNILKEYIDSNSIMGIPHKLKPEYYANIMQGLDALEKSIQKAKKRLEKMSYVDEEENKIIQVKKLVDKAYPGWKIVKDEPEIPPKNAQPGPDLETLKKKYLNEIPTNEKKVLNSSRKTKVSDISQMLRIESPDGHSMVIIVKNGEIAGVLRY